MYSRTPHIRPQHNNQLPFPLCFLPQKSVFNSVHNLKIVRNTTLSTAQRFDLYGQTTQSHLWHSQHVICSSAHASAGGLDSQSRQTTIIGVITIYVFLYTHLITVFDLYTCLSINIIVKLILKGYLLSSDYLTCLCSDHSLAQRGRIKGVLL